MPKVQPLEKHKLPTSFICLFCDHKTCSVSMCAALISSSPAGSHACN
eukprot:COSAG05_NODE_11406_length_515_cov_0.617788_2_plen_46_part_01